MPEVGSGGRWLLQQLGNETEIEGRRAGARPGIGQRAGQPLRGEWGGGVVKDLKEVTHVVCEVRCAEAEQALEGAAEDLVDARAGDAEVESEGTRAGGGSAVGAQMPNQHLEMAPGQMEQQCVEVGQQSRRSQGGLGEDVKFSVLGASEQGAELADSVGAAEVRVAQVGARHSMQVAQAECAEALEQSGGLRREWQREGVEVSGGGRDAEQVAAEAGTGLRLGVGRGLSAVNERYEFLEGFAAATGQSGKAGEAELVEIAEAGESRALEERAEAWRDGWGLGQGDGAPVAGDED